MGEDEGGASAQATAEALGLSVVDLTPAIARQIGVPSSQKGVVVSTVDPESDAARKGIRRGFLITSVNRRAVNTAEDLDNAIQRAKRSNREAVLMHAVARLALHPYFENIQTSWVKMGPEGIRACLAAGANDLGGALMNETITRAAGASHGEEMGPEQMEALIRSLGRMPRQRTTLYDDAPPERIAVSFGAAALEPVRLPPATRYDRRPDRPGTLVRPGIDAAD